MTGMKNSYFIISLWHGTANALALLHYPILQIIQCFKNCLSEYFTCADEKKFINLRRGKRYTNEIEKLNRDNSDLTITIKL